MNPKNIPSRKVMTGAAINGLAVLSVLLLQGLADYTVSASDALAITTGLIFALQYYVTDKKPDNVL